MKEAMKQFMGKDFMLDTPTAESLYTNYAAKMPIFDYHSHISPEAVATGRQFSSLTELWIDDDIYKRRAMRTNGVKEKYCFGHEVSDWERFEKWAETVPYTICTPLYHMTYLELYSAFGITQLLNKDNAREVYDRCNDLLRRPEYSARGLLRRYNVKAFCTTDDPTDDLRWHRLMKENCTDLRMLPTFRPDRAMNIEQRDFAAYVRKLGDTAGVNVTHFDDLMEALQRRHDYFAANDCRLSDHNIEEFYDEHYTSSQIEVIFEKAMRGQTLSQFEIHQYKHCFLTRMSEMDYDSGWAQEYHCGAIRDNNSLMFDKLGSNISYDSIGEFSTALAMSHFLNELNSEGKLTRTILFAINPNSDEMIATMLGNFQDGTCPGKIQFGLGWWLHNQYDVIQRHLRSLCVDGALSRFIGIMTDAHALISYPRHEYFRRLLCNMIGNDVEEGLIPHDEKLLGRLICDISYNNVASYLSGHCPGEDQEGAAQE